MSNLFYTFTKNGYVLSTLLLKRVMLSEHFYWTCNIRGATCISQAVFDKQRWMFLSFDFLRWALLESFKSHFRHNSSVQPNYISFNALIAYLYLPSCVYSLWVKEGYVFRTLLRKRYVLHFYTFTKNGYVLSTVLLKRVMLSEHFYWMKKIMISCKLSFSK